VKRLHKNLACRYHSVVFASLLTLALGCPVHAQRAEASLPDAPKPLANDSDTVTLRNTPLHIFQDQGLIWTSPIRIRPHDLKWLLPLGAATGVAIATDQRALRDFISLNSSFNNDNTNISNVLIGGFIAAPIGLYAAGHFTDDQHLRETGILSGESLIDGVVVEQGMKLIFWRERPTVDRQRGRFFQSGAGVDSSFPSSHAVLAWAAASSIASEYPNTWTRIVVYTGATGISLTRLMGQQHFPSDVLVGSAAGWLIGRYVVHHRHRWHNPISR
jgi:membrane-associated phospholipid phosphatase